MPLPDNRKNHTWIKPYDLTPDEAVDDLVTREYESTWYRLRDRKPGDLVVVTLTKCAVDYTLLGFVDVRAKANELLQQVQAAAAPATQQLLIAGTVDADDMDSDDMDSDDMDSDDMDSDDMDSDDMDSDDMDSDDMDSDDMDSDDMDSGDITRFGDVYASAQRRALRAASVTPGVADETVTLVVRAAGDLYFRVRGHHGAFAPEKPFWVTAQVITSDVCEKARLEPFEIPKPDIGKATTLIVTNSSRPSLTIGDAAGPFNEAIQRLAAATNGYVLDLAPSDDADPVARAYRAWEDAPRCIPAAMVIVNAIRDLIRRLSSERALESVVIVGADDVIPFARLPDHAEISRESRWSGPYEPETPLDAALAQDFYLSDGPYGTPQAITRLGRELFVPTIPVGRLVETAHDIVAHIDWYERNERTDGPIKLEKALVTGYGFVADLAGRVTEALTGGGVDIGNIRQMVSDDWSADDLRMALFGGPRPGAKGEHYDLIAAQGHYSANTLVPANDGPRFRSRELDAVPVANRSFAGTIWATIGCHSGHDIVNREATPFAQPLSFVEPLLARGTTVVAGTGYQYGETELTTNSERLYWLFTEELTYGADLEGRPYQDDVSIGRALANAKARYLDELLALRGIDEKAVGVATLYGVPTLRVHAHVKRKRPPRARVTPEPAVVSGTKIEGIARQTVALKDFDLSGRIALPFRPVLPAVFEDVTATTGAIAVGVIWHSGTFVDEKYEPRIARPFTEKEPPKPRYRNRAFLPARPLRLTHFAPGRDTLVFAPRQVSSEQELARTWRTAAFEVYYSSRADPTVLHDAPALRNPRVVAVNGALRVSVDVRHYGSEDEIVTVYASYIGGGVLASEPLGGGPSKADGNGWVRSFSGQIKGGARALGVFFQAVGGNGHVAALKNGGRHFTVTHARGQAATRLDLVAPDEAQYRDRIVATARLLDADGKGLTKREILFRLGDSRIWTLTDPDGVAKATLTVAARPRDLPPLAAGDPRRRIGRLIVASFPGTANDAPSAASKLLTTVRAATEFEIEPKELSRSAREVVARLVLSSSRRPLGERAVIVFRGDHPMLDQRTLVYTDPDGWLRLEPEDLPGGAGGRIRLAFLGDDVMYLPCQGDADVRVRDGETSAWRESV